MADHMIWCAGPMRDLEDGLVPSFVKAGEIRLGDYLPRQHQNGGDVIVYGQRENKLFFYLGVLRGVKLDEPGRRLTFTGYVPFGSPIVVDDERHGVERAELRAPNNGWGAHDFNYIHESAVKAILSLSEVGTEALLWKAVSGCGH